MTISRFYLFVFFLSWGTLAQSQDLAITWLDQQKSITITGDELVMPGLRHREEKARANSCHKTYLAAAQRSILEPRFAADERCRRDPRRSQRFELIIDGKKQQVVTCTRLAPRFERMQGQMVVCHRQRDP